MIRVDSAELQQLYIEILTISLYIIILLPFIRSYLISIKGDVHPIIINRH